MLVLYPTFVLNIVHRFPSLLVVIHRSFHLLIPKYAVCHITSQKAENAIYVAKILQDMTNTFFSVKTVRRVLRGTGMKAVTKQR